MFLKLRFALGAIVAFSFALIGARGAQTESYYPEGAWGYDVSFPQCGQTLPTNGAFAIVGVTNGLAWSANPCLATEYNWAKTKPFAPSFYTNTGNPGPQSTRWGQPGPATCANPSSYSDEGCAYNYGWNAAGDAFQVATNAVGLTAARDAFWWLDVETANSWNGTWASNTAAINGWLDFLNGVAFDVGIYSTPYQWGQITGGATGNIPSWLAGSTTMRGAQLSCTGTLTGGPTLLTQRVVTLDVNEACANPVPRGDVASLPPGGHLTAPPQKRQPKASPTATASPPPRSTATPKPKRGDPILTPRIAP